jgi:hypothetical protein
MSYQMERETFIARMTQEGLPLHITRSLLRSATTLQRYAEAQCNGDYPADNGERKVVPCSRCEQSWVPSFLRKADKVCKDCTTVDRLTALLPAGFTLDTQGDPRGYVLRIIPPSYAERNAGKDRFNLDTVGVPTRNS